ncbi:isoprenoid biosynthesis glyoxalase ElbB [Pelagibaculum spongiae]|uniref:Glyoxalase n=1 Tax=Pelagibaculum spongiae TaxID=2080658 RepID=A0A2V1H0S8_9GAMM|nr:isoprenoid biosynthesis glyoxalase ElbB [Pelagibaculum spongiae]PVZ69673.1 isoprenoid biosynthesis protein ElbB [Pelagibaculum spongiae]
MKVAVILSGCGAFDGSEIYETTLTLLAIDQADESYQCMAPNIEQFDIINHLTGDIGAAESRNVLTESARLARGEIIDLEQAEPDDYQAVIIPGGFGAAINLSDFASKGAELSIDPHVRNFIQAMHRQQKPIGLIGIAPALSAELFGPGVGCSIGNDPQTAEAIETSGAKHHTCEVDDIFIDLQNKLVTTPAYMLASRISEAATGINKLVQAVIKLAH